MTKSQNMKNEQQKDLCITSEQLTDGYHYAIVFDEERIIEKKKDLPIPYCGGFCYQNYQYLALGPSYDEWKASYNCMFENEVLRLKNAQLKELLKECKNILKEQNFYRNTPIETDMTYRTRCLKKQELLKKIDELLK